jgi:hypothetical protein
MPKKPHKSTAIRGYGGVHQARRAQLAPYVAAGMARCSICHQPIVPGQKWDLDHTPDKSGYRGPAHAGCNRSEGAKRGNAKRRRYPPPWKSCAHCKRPFLASRKSHRFCSDRCRYLALEELRDPEDERLRAADCRARKRAGLTPPKRKTSREW